MKRSRQLLLALLAMFAWSSAVNATTVTENFDDVTVTNTTTLSNGWVILNGTVGSYVGSNDYSVGYSSDVKPYGNNGKALYAEYGNNNKGKYVIIPTALQNKLKFYYKSTLSDRSKYSSAIEIYEATVNGDSYEVGTTPLKSITPSKGGGWVELSDFDLGTKGTIVAIMLQRTVIDDVEYEIYEKTEGAALGVKDGLNTISSGYKYSYGLVDAGAEKVFTLFNTGSQDLALTAAATNGFGTELSAATLPAGSEITLTVKAPTTSANGIVTITPAAGSGLEAFTIAVSATVKESGKMFIDFTDGMPEDWETTGIGEYYGSSYTWTVGEGYVGTTAGNSSYAGALTTTEMQFDADETLYFKAQKYGTSTFYSPSVTVQYFNGTEWKNANETPFTNMNTEDWTDYTVTIPAGTKRLRFYGWYVKLTSIYGGVLKAVPARPKLAVDGIENGGSLSWGYADVPAGTEKTVTLKNTGKADLKVAFAATDDYTLSATEATIKAGETFDLTIGTPAHDGEGVLTITPAAESGLAVYTINLKSYYKVPKAMMDIQTTKVEFGKVYADAKETITVSNTGDADLTATIASDNEKFVVSAASITVKQGETGTFDITYKYDGTVSGMQTATITVTPNDGSAQKITASANNKKAGVWSEDFEEGIPASWTNDGWTVGYSINDGSDVKRASAGMSNGYLITPRLKAEADEELTFDFIGQWALLKVEWANELEGTWTLYNTYGSTEESTPLTTITFKAPAAGNYYLRFSGSGSYLDNFEGFNLDRLPADAIVKSSSLPATGNQYAEYKASVTIENKGSEAQTAVAQLYFKGEVKDTQEQALAVDGQAKIDLSFIPEEAAEDAEVKIVVTLKGVLGFTKTVEGTVTIAEVETISETAANTFEADKNYVGVRLNYTAKNGWSTIALPFAPTSEQMTQIFGEGWKAYYFNKYNEGVLSFQSTTFIRAGVPFIVYTENAPAVAPVLLNVTITATEASADESNGASFKATWSPIAAPGMEGKWGINDQAKIAKGTAKASINGLRGYFELPAASEARIEFYDGDTVTAIGSVEAVKDQSNDTYNLQGQRINQRTVKKGLYIVNGKKMIVK